MIQAPFAGSLATRGAPPRDSRTPATTDPIQAEPKGLKPNSESARPRFAAALDRAKERRKPETDPPEAQQPRNEAEPAHAEDALHADASTDEPATQSEAAQAESAATSEEPSADAAGQPPPTTKIQTQPTWGESPPSKSPKPTSTPQSRTDAQASAEEASGPASNAKAIQSATELQPEAQDIQPGNAPGSTDGSTADDRNSEMPGTAEGAHPRGAGAAANPGGDAHDDRRANPVATPQGRRFDPHVIGEATSAAPPSIEDANGAGTAPPRNLAGEFRLEVAESAPAPTTGAQSRAGSGGAGASVNEGRHSAESQREAPPAAHVVSRALTAALAQKGGVVHVRLVPESLGEVRIQVALEAAAVSVRIDATTSAAQQLLGDHMAMLRSSLESHGLQVDRLSVHVAPPSSPATPSASGNSTNSNPGDAASQGNQHDAGGSQSRGRDDGQANHRQPTAAQDADAADSRPRGSFSSRLRLRLSTVA